jgi:hypothetical protein
MHPLLAVNLIRAYQDTYLKKEGKDKKKEEKEKRKKEKKSKH